MNMLQTKSESIRDLIRFYESGESKASVRRCSTLSSYNLADKALSSNSNSDKSSTSSYSSKSSSSVSLSAEDPRKIDLSLVSSSLKENHRPLKRTETFNGCRDNTLRQESVANTANLSKRKSMSFYVSKTAAKSVKKKKKMLRIYSCDSVPSRSSAKHFLPKREALLKSVRHSRSSFHTQSLSCSFLDQNSPKSLTRTNSTGLSSNVKKFDPRSVQKMVLEWCQNRTRSYKNVNITNFSSSWADGLAFCALVHSYMPQAFDYNKLSSQNRRYNLQLAFDVAYKMANIVPLLEVNDMISMGNRPDDRCVFTYLSTIYSKLNSARHRVQSLEEIKEHVK
ncbi:Smoothelin 2 [Brachionus plicatilis]|uniref:Smoothelin 2 n=1 Tax=Brachionus plicatilis TaxID=10195 RepID=A0A3M7T542_BRAPC|nr:Smoothelin 2 [Brachionus plicatilis]